MKAVRFEKFGGVDVLHIEEIEKPTPAKDQVLIKVKAAGINPGEVSIREGLLEKMFPTTFPCGEGSDMAGTIEALGAGVEGFAIGDEVIAFSHTRGSHAEFALADAHHITKKPAEVTWEQAGGLFVAGTTAWASVKAVSLQQGDTVVVSGAAGGVGSIAAQLAKIEGATVIGLAGKENHEWLASLGIVPVAYGDGMEDRIREASNSKLDAFIDTFGKGYVAMAIGFGIPADRINTIIDFEAVHKYGVKSEGSAKAATADALAQLAELIADGKLDMPIAKVFPLTQVREAYTELEKRHTRGKIVLVP